MRNMRIVTGRMEIGSEEKSCVRQRNKNSTEQNISEGNREEEKKRGRERVK